MTETLTAAQAKARTPAANTDDATSPGSGGRRGTWRGAGARIASAAVVLAIWQVAGDDSRQINFPTVTRTLRSLWDLTASGELPRAVWDSDQTLFLGYAIGLAVAVPLGLAMGTSRVFRAAFRPYVTVMMAIPMIAVIPVLQAIFGLGFSTRVLVVVLFTIPYVTTAVATGTASLPVDLAEMSRSFSRSRWHRFRTVVLLHALPTALTGIRLGLAHALIGMIIAELYLVSTGIGSILTYYRGQFDAGAVFAIAIAVVVQGYLLLGLARLAERHAIRKVRPA